jgi:hypothetical protein
MNDSQGDIRNLKQTRTFTPRRATHVASKSHRTIAQNNKSTAAASTDKKNSFSTRLSTQRKQPFETP